MPSTSQPDACLLTTEREKKALRCYCLGLQDVGHINYEQMKWSQNRDELCNSVWL